ncbi:Serine/threonine-protein kinase spk-1 [Fusarium oxysporum f. sp. albedinis]|nr:Serine/threonine-protein kinase spk-1 [Fusarium oxysporum f. sp. albedinis]
MLVLLPSLSHQPSLHLILFFVYWATYRLSQLQPLTGLSQAQTPPFHFSPPHSHTYSLEGLSLRPAESLALLRQDDTRRDVSDQLRKRSRWTSHTCKPCFYLHPPLFSEASAVGSILFTTNIQTSRQGEPLYHLTTPTTITTITRQKRTDTSLTQEPIQFLCLCPTRVLWCLLDQLFLTDSISYQRTGL